MLFNFSNSLIQFFLRDDFDMVSEAMQKCRGKCNQGRIINILDDFLIDSPLEFLDTSLFFVMTLIVSDTVRRCWYILPEQLSRF